MKNNSDLTPMMRHYLTTKEEYPDCLLFCRLGDFYELFFDDALTVSRELGLTLTGKACGLPERAPMCGVPHQTLEAYLTKLVNKGYKVAICDQVEDPKFAKGMVKREVTRIVSSGTDTNIGNLDETKNNYICCVFLLDEQAGLSFCDITTGAFFLTEVGSIDLVLDELAKFSPSEVVSADAFFVSGIDFDDLGKRQGIIFNRIDESFFHEKEATRALNEHFRTDGSCADCQRDYPLGTVAAGALLLHLYDTQKIALHHIRSLAPYHSASYMLLDSSARRNLELTETIRDKTKRGSLLWVLDKTKTAMGARTLRNFLEQPLQEKSKIEERLNAVSALSDNAMLRDEIREYLSGIYDFERLLAKVSYKSLTPRDAIALRNSLNMLFPIKTVLANLDSFLIDRIREDIGDHNELAKLLENAIDDDAPLALKDGGIIKSGFDEEIDKLRLAKSEGKNWLAGLEEDERQRTGIKNLKIRYNRVFGYYYEVSNSSLSLVPPDYRRKQTLANAERFANDRLEEIESIIANAEERLYDLEYECFARLRDTIEDSTESLQKTAKCIAVLDVLATLSLVSEENHYARPTLNETGSIVIKDGRHPVVEKMPGLSMFIENDTRLDMEDNRIAIITGPNMAGKSTYMRQTALIVLMAHIGCFVPAGSADISIVDRIFTRVGASDDLAGGQSTFMVEMNEVANILKFATAKSLLILDEIGRGTSTYDGLAIARAVVEHIGDAGNLGAKTLFATHYHELTELEGEITGVRNYCIAVREKGDEIIFLRKIIKGGADKSYGIQVAKLAGVPDSVTERAKEIADTLAQNALVAAAKDKDDSAAPSPEITRVMQSPFPEYGLTQLSLFDNVEEDEVLEELRNLDIGRLTPLEALNILDDLKRKLLK